MIVPWLALLGRVWTEDRPPWSGWLALALFPLGLLVQTPAILVHPKWMAWNGAELFSLSRAHAVILWQRVLHAGPDDLWLWGRGPGVGSTTLLVAVGLSVLVFGAGGLLWRTTRSRIEAAALLPPLAATTALLLAGWLFA